MADNFGDDGVASYLYAADTHNVINGKSSALEDALSGTASVVARAITSTANIIPAATNWAGLTDIPEWQTEDLLKQFDDDLAAYYVANKGTVDVLGDVASMFVPGMGGVKALNYAQVALKGMSKGNIGKNMLRALGTLPDNTAGYAAKAVEVMKDSGNAVKTIDGNLIKALGSAYAQNALEGAAFELAAVTAMGDRSPLFEDHTAKDILYNAALGGGIIGGGILGTASAVQTYGAFKKASRAVDKALNPITHISELEAATPEFAKILNYKQQFDTPPSLEVGEGLAEHVTARALEKRQRELSLSMQESATVLAKGDAQVGKLFIASLKDLPQEAAWAATLHADEIALSSKVTDAEVATMRAEEARAKLIEIAEGKLIVPEAQVVKLEKTAKLDSRAAVKYLNLRGERAGQVDISAPQAMGLADAYSSEVLPGVLSKLAAKATPVGNEWTPVGKSIYEVEARYIAAAERPMQEGAMISATDLPNLEAAYNKGLNQVLVDGVQYDRQQLLSHIKATKDDLVVDMLDMADIDPSASTAKIAKLLNVPETLIEGGYKNSDEAYFAVKDAAELKSPSVIKISYKGDPNTVGVSGDVLSGMAHIMQLRTAAEKVMEKAAITAIGEEAWNMIPKLDDRHVMSATKEGAGAGLLNSASGGYMTIASLTEWMGKVTNTLKTLGKKEINDMLQPSMYRVLSDTEASAQLAAIRHTILSTGEKYVYRDGEVILKDIAKYEEAMELGKKVAKPPMADGVVERIPVNNEALHEFLSTWVEFNDKVTRKEKLLKQAIGKDIGNYGGDLYFPQPDSKKFPFFSIVVPKNPMEGEKSQMLWAATAEELSRLESKVPMQYSILRKTDTERYYKALKDYDYELGFNSSQVAEDLKRSGAASSFFPRTDAPQLMQEMLDWRYRISDRQVRDAVTLKNQTAFSELRRMDADYRALQTSTKGATAPDSAYASYVSTALDIPRASHVPIWTEFNNLAENVYSKTINKVRDVYKNLKSPEELKAVDDAFEAAGIRGVKDAFTDLFANHPAGGKELSKFVMAANGALSTLLLRTDPMNALNNGLGSMVITGAETSWLVKTIRGLGGEAERELLEKAFTKVPGSTKDILSPTKLISSAYKDYWKLVAGDAEMVALKAQFEAAGFMPSMMEQIRSVADAATLVGTETAGELGSRTSTLMKSTGDLLEKVSGNKAVEEMNRFTAAHIAKSLSDTLVTAGGMTPPEQFAFINTFVNRTQGNYLASQRPLMFQGPVGHAISLFQTYSFNMLQHIFRRVENSDKKQLGVLLGLQTSLYGFNGLPAFDFMNRTLVGTAAGNTSGQDAASFVQNAAGDVGKWLLYGSLSNATNLGLYSRGDLNPRHMTILPNSVADIPFISATTNALGALANFGSEVAAGADLGSSFLRGLEHANISRPLAGLAVTMQGLDTGQGYTTTGKNQLFSAFDLYALQTVGRIAGARPLDEAIARDTYHRVQVYDAHRSAELAEVGSAIRDKARGGKEAITEADMNKFLFEYSHRGGDQKNFLKFFQQNVKASSKSVVDALTANAAKPYSQYMQSMLHGGTMQNLDTEE